MNESILRIFFQKDNIMILQTLIESLEGKAMILYTYVDDNLGIMDISFDKSLMNDMISFLKEVSEIVPLIFEPLNYGNA